MKCSFLLERYFPGGNLKLFMVSVTIIAIFCMLSLVTIETSHAAGITATAKYFNGIGNKISEMGGSFTTHSNARLSASSLLFKRPSVKAYRYHHERLKVLKMTMGWVLAPVYYIFKYPKASLFFFFLITLFLAALDELLYRYKRYPSLAEESTGAIAASYNGGLSYALAANQYFFTTPERKKMIDEIHANSKEPEYSLLANSLIAQEPIIYDDKIALPHP
ncbi:MAG: hypothetical protein JRC86_03495 [Deltaproteobacteria bacterium]|nr:hypothetical protein [Deltaproteobacteria bacterium]